MNPLVWLDAGAGAGGEVASGLAAPARAHPGQHAVGDGPAACSDREVPLDVQVLQTETLAKVTRKKITYAAGKGDRVPAYLLIPTGSRAGRPPCCACTGRAEAGGGPPAGPGLPELHAGTGRTRLRDHRPRLHPLGENQTDPCLGYASGTMKGIWDHMRAVDLLESLPEVDGQRIGCIGVSLGGHNALFVGAFDPRIKVVVTSSGFDSFADYMGGDLSGWCQTRYMPRSRPCTARTPSECPSISPRCWPRSPRGTSTSTRPWATAISGCESVKRCVEAARGVYRLLGAGDRLVAVYPPGGHGFPEEAREEAYRFLDKVLARG